MLLFLAITFYANQINNANTSLEIIAADNF